jgi:hypothetical protein
MAVKRIEKYGNGLMVHFTDTTRVLCVPTSTPVWLPVSGAAGPPPPTDPDNPPVDPGNPGTGLTNPWAGWPVTGSWEDHSWYSQGGTDRPLPYGTPLVAPEAGSIVRTSWTDLAGRRTEFRFNNTYARQRAASTTLMNGISREAQGPMVSLVLQHQAEMYPLGAYPKGATIGVSGASADPDDGNYGGDVHLHYHGLDASGARLDFDKFIA